MSSRKLPLWKKLAFVLIILFVPPLLLVGVAEGAGRLVLHYKYGVPGKTYGLWTYDPVLGAVQASNAYNSNSETNSLGFRNKEDVFEPKPPGSLRIIAYGGSTTFCYNLPTEQAWPLQLQDILRARHNPRDQVLNAGAIMWSMSHEITRAERDLPKLHPDYVILYSGINEEANAAYAALQGKDLKILMAKGQSRIFATNLDQNRWLKRNSVLVRFFDYELANFVPTVRRGSGGGDEGALGPPAAQPASGDVDPVVMKHFLVVLNQFIDLIRHNGAKPIYVIMGGDTDSPDIHRRLQYSRNGAELARQKGVPVFDSQEVVDGYNGDKSELFSPSGVHWSKPGAKLLAQFIEAHAFGNYLRSDLPARPLDRVHQ